MLGHSSIVLTADTFTSVLPDVAYKTAEDIAAHIAQQQLEIDKATAEGPCPATQAPPAAGRAIARRGAAIPWATSAHTTSAVQGW
jgi:hypothetical protein